MMKLTFHILPNAHLDPVWLWDWREGMNEGIITTRTILDLMDEFPDLTFIRGEAALYRHIEEHDPATFARLRRMIAGGRWDVVGGTWVQPDTNLPSTETFLRHYAVAQAFFADRFGKTPRVAWAADSFGHSAGLPEILAAAGMEGYVFSRPEGKTLPLADDAFWWQGPGGSRVLAYRLPPFGNYLSERDEVPRKLDRALAHARPGAQVGIFIGLGNHGGGPTRRNIRDVHAWAAAHPEVDVRFSTLHGLMDAVRAAPASEGASALPIFKGELNCCLRGCYASQLRLKSHFRQLEALACRAERIDSVVAASLDRKASDMATVWEAVLFNSFHDILPGSSIERACYEQGDWMGGARHDARRVELTALNALAARIDTRVESPPDDRPGPAILAVFNPHPHPYQGPLELEAALDYRPIWSHANRPEALPLVVRGPDRRPCAHQVIATEHDFMPHLPWRRRVILPATLPPLGWSVFEMAVDEAAASPSHAKDSAVARGQAISNGIYQVTAKPGAGGIRIAYQGRPLFGPGGLHAVTVEDPYGSWGSMNEQPEALNLSTVRHAWRIAQANVLERGPERAALWVRLEGGASRLELTLHVSRRRAAVDVSARLFWNERAARLKLVMPVGAEQAEFDVPGGAITRGAMGEVPGGRWVRLRKQHLGFASDALYAFDLADGALRATLVRATRYASDYTDGPDAAPWQPATDQGEHRFRFCLSPGGADVPRLAAELEMPPVAIVTAAHPGDLGRSGSLASLAPSGFQLLALKPAGDGDGWILRVREIAGRGTTPDFTWLGQPVALDPVAPRRIATWRLRREGKLWKAIRTTAQETPIPAPGTSQAGNTSIPTVECNLRRMKT